MQRQRHAVTHHTCIKLFWMDSDTVKINFTVWCLRSGGFVSVDPPICRDLSEDERYSEFHSIAQHNDERRVSYIVIFIRTNGRQRNGYAARTDAEDFIIIIREHVLHSLPHVHVFYYSLLLAVGCACSRRLTVLAVCACVCALCNMKLYGASNPNACLIQSTHNASTQCQIKISSESLRFRRWCSKCNIESSAIDSLICHLCKMSLVSVDWLIRGRFRHSFVLRAVDENGG